MKILVVDDEVHIRKLTCTILKKSGYEVIEASSGVEALAKLSFDSEIKFVISDWVMSNINGLELCRKIREMFNERYIYIILLTSKTEKFELVEGMNAGADDFIVKPFNVEELKVRIRAGERILNLQIELSEKTQKIERNYEQISNDLKYAHKLQKSLLPSKTNKITFNNTNALINKINHDWLYIPSYFLSGDTFNIFRLDNENIAFYHLDVSGHGIPSSFLSASLNRVLLPSQNSFIKRSTDIYPFYEIINPSEIFKTLNEYFQQNNDDGYYFTISYFIVNLNTGNTVFSVAGHTKPIILRKSGVLEIIEDTGSSIGLLDSPSYDENEIILEAGDKIILYSAGITGCKNKNYESFSEERLTNILNDVIDLPLTEILENIESEVNKWNDKNNFDDDISLLAVEFE